MRSRTPASCWRWIRRPKMPTGASCACTTLAGDRAAALLAFDACERMLKHEVGATPSPETLALLHHRARPRHGAGGRARGG